MLSLLIGGGLDGFWALLGRAQLPCVLTICMAGLGIGMTGGGHVVGQRRTWAMSSSIPETLQEAFLATNSGRMEAHDVHGAHGLCAGLGHLLQ
jgi:hypothetical protein